MATNRPTSSKSNETPEDVSATRGPIKAITDKFTFNGNAYYQLEWSDSTNTWEPQSDIQRADMIARYERNPPTRTDDKDTVLGVIPDEKLYFLIRPKNQTEAVFLTPEMANVNYPQAVIEFYQDRIVWLSRPSQN